MCFPYLKGGVQVEERYPRTNDPREPRRRRLHFVRNGSHSPRSSDEWTLTRSSFNTTRPRRDHLEMREQIRALEQRQHQLAWENQHQRQMLQHTMHQHQHQQPRPMPIGWDQHHGGGGGGGGGGHHPAVRMLPQHRLEDDDEIVEEWQGPPPPRVIEAKPRAHMPDYVRAVGHHGRGRSRSRHRRDHSGSSIYSDSLRGHRSRYSSNDSFEDLNYPVRRRWR